MELTAEQVNGFTIQEMRQVIANLYPETPRMAIKCREFPIAGCIFPGWYIVDGEAYRFAKTMGYPSRPPRDGHVLAMIPTKNGNYMLKQLAGPVADAVIETELWPLLVKEAGF